MLINITNETSSNIANGTSSITTWNNDTNSVVSKDETMTSDDSSIKTSKLPVIKETVDNYGSDFLEKAETTTFAMGIKQKDISKTEDNTVETTVAPDSDIGDKIIKETV